MAFQKLDTGDAIYVPADAPHAYLSGDDIVCNALTYNPYSEKEVLLGSEKSKRGNNRKTLEYAPPMSEFNMLRTTLGKVEKETVDSMGGPSVFFLTEG